jgi:HPt (histidine-containing phosphotransfer) domain-containing protein
VADDDLFAAVERLLEGKSPVGGNAPPAETSTDSAIDRSAILRQVRGETSLLLELVELFDMQSRQLFDQLLLAHQEGDSSAMAKLAHQLAGSAGNFRASSAMKLARSMESQAKLGEAIRTAEIEQLRSELEKVRLELQQWTAELGEPKEVARP